MESVIVWLLLVFLPVLYLLRKFLHKSEKKTGYFSDEESVTEYDDEYELITNPGYCFLPYNIFYSSCQDDSYSFYDEETYSFHHDTNENFCLGNDDFYNNFCDSSHDTFWDYQDDLFFDDYD